MTTWAKIELAIRKTKKVANKNSILLAKLVGQIVLVILVESSSPLALRDSSSNPIIILLSWIAKYWNLRRVCDKKIDRSTSILIHINDKSGVLHYKGVSNVVPQTNDSFTSLLEWKFYCILQSHA